jgi:NAD(P)-dependent dehydrogenase (short-subunit alcohol dehydrogenase family)
MDGLTSSRPPVKAGAELGMAEARSVVVTGASRGLGLATAAHLFRAGWTVVAAVRSPDDGLERLRALTGAPTGDPRLLGIRLDLEDPGSIEAAAHTVLDSAGAPHGLVHNAGIAGVGCLEELPMQTWEQIFSTNFFGPVRLTRTLLPAMRAAGRGRIVMVSSQGAVRGMPGIGAYSASKGALERWAESLSFEIAPFGLGVTVLVAGTFKTDILELTRTSADPDGPYGPLHLGLETAGRRFLRLAGPPERFAPAVERALAEGRPFTRHGVGIDARLLLLGNRLMPSGLVQRITTRAVGIPRPRSLRGDPLQRAHVTQRPEDEKACS